MKILYWVLIVLTGTSATYAVDWRPALGGLVIRESLLIFTVLLALLTFGLYLYIRTKEVSPYEKDNENN